MRYGRRRDQDSLSETAYRVLQSTDPWYDLLYHLMAEYTGNNVYALAEQLMQGMRQVTYYWFGRKSKIYHRYLSAASKVHSIEELITLLENLAVLDRGGHTFIRLGVPFYLLLNKVYLCGVDKDISCLDLIAKDKRLLQKIISFDPDILFAVLCQRLHKIALELFRLDFSFLKTYLLAHENVVAKLFKDLRGADRWAIEGEELLCMLLDDPDIALIVRRITAEPSWPWRLGSEAGMHEVIYDIFVNTESVRVIRKLLKFRFVIVQETMNIRFAGGHESALGSKICYVLSSYMLRNACVAILCENTEILESGLKRDEISEQIQKYINYMLEGLSRKCYPYASLGTRYAVEYQARVATLYDLLNSWMQSARALDVLKPFLIRSLKADRFSRLPELAQAIMSTNDKVHAAWRNFFAPVIDQLDPSVTQHVEVATHAEYYALYYQFTIAPAAIELSWVQRLVPEIIAHDCELLLDATHKLPYVVFEFLLFCAPVHEFIKTVDPDKLHRLLYRAADGGLPCVIPALLDLPAIIDYDLQQPKPILIELLACKNILGVELMGHMGFMSYLVEHKKLRLISSGIENALSYLNMRHADCQTFRSSAFVSKLAVTLEFALTHLSFVEANELVRSLVEFACKNAMDFSNPAPTLLAHIKDFRYACLILDHLESKCISTQLLGSGAAELSPHVSLNHAAIDIWADLRCRIMLSDLIMQLYELFAQTKHEQTLCVIFSHLQWLSLRRVEFLYRCAILDDLLMGKSEANVVISPYQYYSLQFHAHRAAGYYTAEDDLEDYLTVSGRMQIVKDKLVVVTKPRLLA